MAYVDQYFSSDPLAAIDNKKEKGEETEMVQRMCASPDPPTIEDMSDGEFDLDLRPSEEQPGLFMCDRCGRMWDGNAQCFPCVDDADSLIL